MMMNCNEARDLITLYIDNELQGEKLEKFKEHVESCEACRIELAEITRVVELCADMPEEELPETFKEQLHSKLVDVSRQDNNNRKVIFFKNSYLKVITTVAAVFLVFVALSGIYGNDLLKGRFLNLKDMNKTAQMDEKKMESSEAEIDAGMAEDQSEAQLRIASGEAGASSALESDASKSAQPREAWDSDGTAKDVTRGTMEGRSFMMTALPELREIRIAANTDDIEKVIGKIEEYADELGLEAAKKDDTNQNLSIEPTAKFAGEKAEMQLIVPNASYEGFIQNLKSDPELSKILSFGEMQKLNADDYINKLNSELDQIIQLIDKTENSGSTAEKSKETLKQLKEKRDSIQAEIESITINPDCTIVKFEILKEG